MPYCVRCSSSTCSHCTAITTPKFYDTNMWNQDMSANLNINCEDPEPCNNCIDIIPTTCIKNVSDDLNCINAEEDDTLAEILVKINALFCILLDEIGDLPTDIIINDTPCLSFTKTIVNNTIVYQPLLDFECIAANVCQYCVPPYCPVLTFSINTITKVSFIIHINETLDPEGTYQISLDGGATYLAGSFDTQNHTVTGLTPGTTYNVVIKSCCKSKGSIEDQQSCSLSIAHIVTTSSCVTSGGFMFILAAPDYNDTNNTNGIDRSVIKAEFDETAIIGLTAPLTIHDWTWQGAGITPISLNDAANNNKFQRHQFNFQTGAVSITAKVTDVYGCTHTVGNTVDVDELRCVGDIAVNNNFVGFTISNITTTSFKVNITNPVVGATYDISFDHGNTYQVIGATLPIINVTGLTSGTEYSVYVKVNCSANPSGGWMGLYKVETL